MAKKTKKNKLDRYIDALHQIDNRLVIITGANSGLGFEMAKVALIKGARVVMACRNKQRAEDARQKIIEETGKDNIEIFLYDQSDIKSVHNFATAIKNKYKDFYALVLNAGVMFPPQVVDEYHVSTVYRVNFLGAYALIKDLEDFLNNATEEKRIIIQGSLATYLHKYKNKDKFIYGDYRPFKQYCLSKLCCSNIFAHYRDNNKNENVKYLLCEPGAAATEIVKSFKPWFKKIAQAFVATFNNSAKKGCLDGCKLMCDDCVNGDYYKPRCFFSLVGMPKKAKYPRRYIFPSILSDADEMIKQYEQR